MNNDEVASASACTLFKIEVAENVFKFYVCHQRQDKLKERMILDVCSHFFTNAKRMVIFLTIALTRLLQFRVTISTFLRTSLCSDLFCSNFSRGSLSTNMVPSDSYETVFPCNA